MHFFTEPRIPARGNDGGSVPLSDGFVADLGVIGAVGTDRMKRLVRWNLRKQSKRHRCVSDGVVGDLDGSDLQDPGIYARCTLIAGDGSWHLLFASTILPHPAFSRPCYQLADAERHRSHEP